MLKINLLLVEYSVYFIRMFLKNYILEFFNLIENDIRIKEVRKIYILTGNNQFKANIETFLSNLSKHNINENKNGLQI